MMNKENISTKFLLPSLEFSDEVKSLFYDFGFINTYLECNKLEYSFEVIYLLFKPKKFNEKSFNFFSILQLNPNYIEVYDLGDNYVLFTFRVPKKFRSDYYHFLEGKYSKFSNEYKKLFPDVSIVVDSNGRPIREGGRIKKEPSSFYHIFNKTQYLKNIWKERLGISDDNILEEVELYDIVDKEKEKLNININL